MPEYVQKAFEQARVNAVKRIYLKIQEIKSRNAANGMLFSGATIRESIISVEDEIVRFFRAGIDVLTRNDPEHSGVKAAHFDELNRKIDQLYPELLDEFKREFERISDKFPEGSIENSAIVNDALLERLHNEVDEQKYVINSKTSFWKWAFGDIKKRIWTAMIAGLGIVGSYLAQLLWKVMS